MRSTSLSFSSAARPHFANRREENSAPDAASAATATFADTRRWFALAIGSLVLAGLLSLALVIGRIPVIGEWIADPLFFNRYLVVHVNLALVLWFHASTAAWLGLSGGPGARSGPSFLVALAGVGLMVLAGAMRGAQPVLSNYVPVIDRPVFLAGSAVYYFANWKALADVWPVK